MLLATFPWTIRRALSMFHHCVCGREHIRPSGCSPTLGSFPLPPTNIIIVYSAFLSRPLLYFSDFLARVILSLRVKHLV